MDASDTEQKVYLNAYDRKNVFVENNSYWTYSLLKERLFLKYNILAIVFADSKFVSGVEYFKYSCIKFYKIKGFDSFIEAIKKDKVYITFKVGTFKSGKRIGQIHDQGTGFCINYSDICFVFDEIDFF